MVFEAILVTPGKGSLKSGGSLIDIPFRGTEVSKDAFASEP